MFDGYMPCKNKRTKLENKSESNSESDSDSFSEDEDSDFSENEDSDDDKTMAKNLYGRSLCQTHMESIVIGLKHRFLSRLALARQLSVLEKAKLTSVPDLPIPQQFQKEFPTPKTQCRIRAWYAVEWEQYSGLDVTRHLVETKAVTSNDFFFFVFFL